MLVFPGSLSSRTSLVKGVQRNTGGYNLDVDIFSELCRPFVLSGRLDWHAPEPVTTLPYSCSHNLAKKYSSSRRGSVLIGPN